MNRFGRTTMYDLFKAIVAILLLILFFYLRRVPIPQSPPPDPTASSAAVLLTAGSTATPERALTSPPATSLPASATASPIVSPGQADPSTPDATLPASPTETDSDPTAVDTGPPVALTPDAEATPTPTASTPVPVTACEGAQSRPRLGQGMNATILRRLNFRSSPGIGNNWLRTNIPGTPVEIVGGPECLPYYMGAYVWWQVRLPDGEIGWSAEGSMHGSFYFMEPAE